ncbi:hypothetical protein MN608_00601 [Microdochium nivale]|nr:hypothetical protein MN608_00601 [Microdochium nivale]
MKRSRSPQSEQDSPQILDELEAVDTARKIVGLDDPDTSPATAFEMRCTLPPHREPVAFHSYGDYEAHYGKEHVYRCTECHRNLPSAHYLGLHFEECHDPFAAIKRDKGEHTVSPGFTVCYLPVTQDSRVKSRQFELHS